MGILPAERRNVKRRRAKRRIAKRGADRDRSSSFGYILRIMMNETIPGPGLAASNAADPANAKLALSGPGLPDPARIGYIAMDMDGTILDASYRISPMVSRTLCILQSSGKRLIIATGRVLGAAVRFLEGAFEPDGYVCTNGADIFGPGRIRIASHHLPAGGLRILAGLARSYPFLFCFYTGEQWVYERPTPMVPFYEKRTGIRGIRTDLDLVIKDDVLKCLVLGPHEGLLEVREKIESEAGSLLSTVFSHEEMLEVMAGGVSKSRGLEECLRFFGASLEEVIAFGDAENDLDMLMEAGVGVAMGNAPESVKARVPWVTESVDENGVALFLRRLFPHFDYEAK